MKKVEYKVKDGKLIRVQLTRENDEIEEIKITGDFFLYPEEVIEDLEKRLTGHPLREGDLKTTVKSILEKRDATLMGASSEDLVRCILMAGGKDD